MRNAWFDRRRTGSRHGMRRAAVAAWVVVFALFAVLLVPGLAGTVPQHTASSDRVIAGLVAHVVQPVSDSCHCDDDDHMMMAPAPALC